MKHERNKRGQGGLQKGSVGFGTFLGKAAEEVAAFSWGGGITVCLLLILIIATLDVLAGPEISLAFLYLAPVAVGTWRFGWNAGLAISALGTILAFALAPIVPYWHGLTHFAVFLSVAYVLSLLARTLQWVRTDYLTGLTNARGLGEVVDRELHRAIRTGRMVTIACLDIDDFNAINDRFGRSRGDSVLQSVAQTLTKATRRGDILSRIGGDEFVILLPETDFFGAAVAVQNIRTALVKVFEEKNWSVTFSIGAATFQTAPESTDTAITHAEALLHAGKTGGKNTTVHRLIGGVRDYAQMA